MLAYVFSHRPAGGADVADYEAALKRFHAALATAPPAGFLGSSTFRVGDRYSDWYLVANSAALDLLNEAAVSGARTPVHDAAARMAVDGVGKLYSLAAGEARSPAGFEIHFSKPAGTSYADLYERMQPFTGRPETSLWRRMMVLGPPPEFCLLSRSELELPREYRAEVLQRDQI
ncbi:MAG TPA: hypothetical protein VEL12_02090 [Candidatus Nitrosopolaris sp.]|nr:hypothetical protein [Candidatus Nitrosopolaris sp.]